MKIMQKERIFQNWAEVEERAKQDPNNMLTKVLLVCTQGFYKNEAHRPRIT